MKRSQPRRKGPIKIRCSHCRREFCAWPYQVGLKRFCSKDCYTESQKREVEMICVECGERFTTKASKIKEGRKYCSRSCWAKNSRLTDEQYAANAERMHRERRGEANPAFKHGRDGDRAWRSRFNLELKGETACRVCGSTKHLQLHHAIPRSLSRAARDELRNGLPLCARCHRQWHLRTLTIYRDVFTEDEWLYLSSVELSGQRIEAWLDDRYPAREKAAA